MQTGVSALVDQGLWLETRMASVSPKASEQRWQPQKSSARLEDSQNPDLCCWHAFEGREQKPRHSCAQAGRHLKSPEERRESLGPISQTLHWGLNNGPKDVHVLIFRSYKYVTRHGKRDFADVIMDLELRRSCITWVGPRSSQRSCKKETKGSESEKGKM